MKPRVSAIPFGLTIEAGSSAPKQGLDLVYFADLRGERLGAKLVVEVGRELDAALLLAVHRHELRRASDALEVREQGGPAAVRREVELPHLGLDLRRLAVYQRQTPVEQRPPRCPRDLEADERYAVLLLLGEPARCRRSRRRPRASQRARLSRLASG